MWQIWIGLGVLMTMTASFLWWRSMRWDYDEEKIFGAVLGLSVLMALVYSGWKFILGLNGNDFGPGFIAGISYWFLICRKNGWDFWEWLEIIVPFAMMLLVLVSLILGSSNWISVLSALAGWIGFKAAKITYKRMKWYVSGKIGAASLFSLLLWSIVQMMVEIGKANALYWAGLTPAQWTAVIVFTITIIAIYLRSGRKITKDLPIFK